MRELFKKIKLTNNNNEIYNVKTSILPNKKRVSCTFCNRQIDMTKYNIFFAFI